MLLSAGLALALFAFADVPGALAAIGPTATLAIANAQISPDGFSRSYVQFFI